MNAYAKKTDLAEKLVELRKDGVKLRNRRLQKGNTPDIDGLILTGWKDEVDAWEKRVLDTIRGQVSAADYGRFETLNTYPPMHFGWQINALHSQYLSMLSRRIDILLRRPLRLIRPGVTPSSNRQRPVSNAVASGEPAH